MNSLKVRKNVAFFLSLLKCRGWWWYIHRLRGLVIVSRIINLLLLFLKHNLFTLKRL